MNTLPAEPQYRILIVDDNPAIHEDFRKILAPEQSALGAELASLGAELLGEPEDTPLNTTFEVMSAFQGQEALDMVKAAAADEKPYSLAFMDVRMPPGWDGIETVAQIWREHPEIQVVICTAYSDYSLEEILRKLGRTDNLLILKKPFDSVEVLQLAYTLTQKWSATRQAHARMADLDELVRQRTLELLEANHKLEGEIRRRSLMETAIRESEERFRKAFECCGAALAIQDLEKQVFIDTNESFEKLAGYSHQELSNRTPKELGLFARQDEHDQILAAAAESRVTRGQEVELCPRNGKGRRAVVSLDLFTLSGRRCVLWSVVDITEQRELEEQLRHAQKMEAVGQLAAGLAHDFNNLLTVIHGYASLQLAKANLDTSVSKAFEQVKLASERAASLTRQLLAFSRKQVVQCKAFDANALLRRTEQMFTHLLGANIVLACEMAPSLPKISADESNLEQVLVNLVVNARDAMPTGGHVRIATSLATITPAQAKLNPNAREGSYVVISVTDTGCGMDSSTLRRIFDPFFTTKPIGKGTGLGLATAYGILRQHDGWVDVRSTPGAGSTFSLFLPAYGTNPPTPSVPAPVLPAAPGMPVPVTSRQTQTILVVEDEPDVRAFVVAVLAASGYRVTEAASGLEALNTWGSLPEPVDLLLTDMVMPAGISGGALAGKLRQTDSDLRVLFMSGYSPESVSNGERLEEGVNFLPKPFTSDKLLAAVRTSLARA